MSNHKTPSIRFKGFTDDWEQRKLEDMCSIITKQTGFDYSATIKPSLVTSKETDTYSFIQNKDFEGMNINLDTDFYIPISVANKYPKITLDQPSLLISISGRIGNVGLYLLDSKAFIGGAVGICKLNDIEDGKTALYELLAPTGQRYFNSLIKASSHANITVEDIRQIEVLLPKNRDEKVKLNRFFENIDHLITLHQRKYEKLVNVKKSMLDKMFPKNGFKVPEIRFKGFTDDWEQRKLAEISKTTIGEFVIKSKQKNKSPYPVYNGGTSYTGFYDNFNNEGNKILVSARGANAGFVNIVKTRYWAGNSCYSIDLIDKSKYDTDFVYQEMKRNQSRFIDNQQAANIPSVSKADVEKFEIIVPTFEEQRKIAEHFTNLDLLITLHQRELEKLQNLKKSLLNSMFI